MKSFLVFYVSFFVGIRADHWFVSNATSLDFHGCGSPNKIIGDVGATGQRCDNECSGWQPARNQISVLTLNFPEQAEIGANSKLRIYGSWPSSSSLVVSVGNYTVSPDLMCDCGFVDISLPSYLVSRSVGSVQIIADPSDPSNIVPPPKKYCFGFSNLFIVQAAALEYGCAGDCQQGFCISSLSNTTLGNSTLGNSTIEIQNKTSSCSCFSGWSGPNCTVATTPTTSLVISLKEGELKQIRTTCLASRKIQLQIDTDIFRSKINFLVYMNAAVEVKICVGDSSCHQLGPYENMRTTTRVICGSERELEWVAQDGVVLRNIPVGNSNLYLSFPDSDDTCIPTEIGIQWEVPFPGLFLSLLPTIGALSLMSLSAIYFWDSIHSTRTLSENFLVKCIETSTFYLQRIRDIFATAFLAVKNMFRRRRNANGETPTENDDSKRCRVCYESNEPLVSPCECRGTMMYVHESCLRQWMLQSTRAESVSQCELCRSPYTIEILDNRNRAVYNRYWNTVKYFALAVLKAVMVWVVLSLVMQILLALIHSLISFRAVDLSAGMATFLGTSLSSYFCIQVIIRSRGWFFTVWGVPVSSIGILLSVSFIAVASALIKLIAYHRYDTAWLPGFPWYSEICILSVNFAWAIIVTLLGINRQQQHVHAMRRAQQNVVEARPGGGERRVEADEEMAIEPAAPRVVIVPVVRQEEDIEIELQQQQGEGDLYAGMDGGDVEHAPQIPRAHIHADVD